MRNTVRFSGLFQHEQVALLARIGTPRLFFGWIPLVCWTQTSVTPSLLHCSWAAHLDFQIVQLNLVKQLHEHAELIQLLSSKLQTLQDWSAISSINSKFLNYEDVKNQIYHEARKASHRQEEQEIIEKTIANNVVVQPTIAYHNKT